MDSRLRGNDVAITIIYFFALFAFLVANPVVFLLAAKGANNY